MPISEELGFKVTNTRLYLMDRALEKEGETRPIYEILRSLATSLGLADFFPWRSVEEVLDAILDHPTTGHATVATLRAAGGFLPLKVPHVTYADRKFDSPSGKIEFYSSLADKLDELARTYQSTRLREGREWAEEQVRYPAVASLRRNVSMGRLGALLGRRMSLYVSIPIVVACDVTGYVNGTPGCTAPPLAKRKNYIPSQKPAMQLPFLNRTSHQASRSGQVTHPSQCPKWNF